MQGASFKRAKPAVSWSTTDVNSKRSKTRSLNRFFWHRALECAGSGNDTMGQKYVCPILCAAISPCRGVPRHTFPIYHTTPGFQAKICLTFCQHRNIGCEALTFLKGLDTPAPESIVCDMLLNTSVPHERDFLPHYFSLHCFHAACRKSRTHVL